MRILIVDDDAPFAHMLGEQLERLMPNCTATAVADADAARAAVREAVPSFRRVAAGLCGWTARMWTAWR
jgi:CheY-like chemotaxis protein